MLDPLFPVRLESLTLVCGRYEGVDERVAEHLIEEEASLGDFVLAGGEAAATVVVEPGRGAPPAGGGSSCETLSPGHRNPT